MASIWLSLCVMSTTAVLSSADPLLLFTDRQNIRSYDLETGTSKIVVPTAFQNAVAMGYHYGNQKLYVSDAELNQLLVLDMTTDPPTREVLLSGLTTPDGLSVDWVNNNLYWTHDGKCVTHAPPMCRRLLHSFFKCCSLSLFSFLLLKLFSVACVQKLTPCPQDEKTLMQIIY